MNRFLFKDFCHSPLFLCACGLACITCFDFYSSKKVFKNVKSKKVTFPFTYISTN
ncbi:hypothetical protein HMPREF0623_0034 [Pediococcus acidilactici DSM 20284]|uniref:Lipoprotein n=1 Tax=Pediococcus acidilactici DSM 20284 TaxID=862514 RepID=E0NEH2_PEDAC|nr:hypothetical protein HMPREF0623_0034 [Pediococcus acidilactici DSM 20284]